MRVEATLPAACQSCWEEPESYLYRFIRVQVHVYSAARRLATQQADILAVGPVVRYLLFGDPQGFPALAARIFLAGGNRDHGRATSNKCSGSAPAALRAHAMSSSGNQSVWATSIAAAIAPSGARLSV